MLTNQKIEAALAELEESEKAKLISELKDPDFNGQINSVGVEKAENHLLKRHAEDAVWQLLVRHLVPHLRQGILPILQIAQQRQNKVFQA